MFNFGDFMPTVLGDKPEEEDDINVDIRVGDIVEISTLDRKPLTNLSTRGNDFAQLRVIGQKRLDSGTQYVLLVTDGDAEHMRPISKVNRIMSNSYGVEQRFMDCDVVILYDHHVRRVVKEQRGSFCAKCTDYNENAREVEHPYMCRTCKDNPWR